MLPFLMLRPLSSRLTLFVPASPSRLAPVSLLPFRPTRFGGHNFLVGIVGHPCEPPANHSKARHFKPFACNCHGHRAPKSFISNAYKKHGGWGGPGFHSSFQILHPLIQRVAAAPSSVSRQRFQIRSIQIHRHSSLDQLQRNHQPVSILPPHDNSFHSLKRPAPNPHSPLRLQVSMRLRA
jgi:hypothetical protein